eukprot:COSAG06_NODE_7_length_38054_cov_37.302569_5_plen_211_part_00
MLCEETPSCLEFSSCVCPEPVLTNSRSFLHKEIKFKAKPRRCKAFFTSGAAAHLNLRSLLRLPTTSASASSSRQRQLRVWRLPPARKRAFFEFSLCLSRACLGKKMTFVYKWRKSPFSYQNVSNPPVASGNSAAIAVKHNTTPLHFSTFRPYAFVPSLSWQMIVSFIRKRSQAQTMKRRFPHCRGQLQMAPRHRRQHSTDSPPAPAPAGA